MLLLTLQGRPVSNAQAVETQSAATYPPERPLSGYSTEPLADATVVHWRIATHCCHTRPSAFRQRNSRSKLLITGKRPIQCHTRYVLHSRCFVFRLCYRQH